MTVFNAHSKKVSKLPTISLITELQVISPGTFFLWMKVKHIFESIWRIDCMLVINSQHVEKMFDFISYLNCLCFKRAKWYLDWMYFFCRDALSLIFLIISELSQLRYEFSWNWKEEHDLQNSCINYLTVLQHTRPHL